MKRKQWLYSLIFVLLIGLTVFTICSQSASFTQEGFWEYVRAAHPAGLAAAALCTLLYILLEGLALLTICRALGYRRGVGQGVLYSAADIYFSAITPSATGGQPASAVLMMRSGIPAAPTAVALLINLVLYTLSILLMAAAGLALHPGLLRLFGPASRILIWVGAGTQVALLAGLTLLIFHEPIFLRLADWALKIGHKLHLIRDIESRKQKYAELRDDYQQCSGALRGQWKLILLSFVFNLAQRLAIVLSPVCVYLAEGGNRARTGEAFAAQTMVILGSNAVPLPGSVGVADYLFLDGYRSLAQSPVLLELLSRAISFYSCVVLCGACLRRQTKVKQGTVKRMLGFYNYTVWLTYGSLVSAVIGIFVSLAGHGHPYIGAIFLLISGLCDAFDGMIARTKTDRTEQEKQYGIQIDSLSDLVAFGVLPACIGAGLYKASMIFDPPQDPCLVARVPYPVYVGIFVIYVLAALIRLAYFNVQAEAGCAAGEKVQKVYYGLPVTSSALIFPTFLLLRHLICADIAIGYYAVMLLTALAFVCKFRMRKPTLRTVLIMVGIGGLEFLLILLVKYNGFRAF